MITKKHRTSARHSTRRTSPIPLFEQGLDVGVRLHGALPPTVEQLRQRYHLTLSTAYRRREQIVRYLKKNPDASPPSPE